MPKRYDYAKLLEDDDVRRWYENLRRGSPVVADVNLRRLGYVCRNFQLTPAKLASMTSKEATNLIFDVVAKLENERKKSSYARSYLKALRLVVGYYG